MKSMLQVQRARITQLFQNEAVGGAIVSMMVAGCAAVIGFAMFATASRTMSIAAFGTFAIWFNAMSFLAMTAGLGQETLVMRLWPEYITNRRFADARGALIFGSQLTSISATIFALSTIAVGLALGFSLKLVISGAFFLFSLTLLIYTNHLTRVIAGIIYSDGNKDMTARGLTILAILAVFFSSRDVSAPIVLTIAAASMITAVTIHICIVWRRLPREIFEVAAHLQPKKWLRQSKNMWFATIAEGTSQFLEVIVVGIMLSNVAAGGFFVAQKIANVFAIISGGIAMYATRKISSYFFGDKKPQLHKMLQMLAVIALVLVTTAVVTIILLGNMVLSLFNPIYTEEYYTLVILVIGTVAGTLGGPAPYLLMLTGYEKLYSRTMVFVLVLRFMALGLVVPVWGTMGAAVAWSGSSLLGVIMLNIFCRRHVGFDPSVLILFQKPNYIQPADTEFAPAIARNAHPSG